MTLDRGAYLSRCVKSLFTGMFCFVREVASCPPRRSNPPLCSHGLCCHFSRLGNQRADGSLEFSRIDNVQEDNPMTTASLARMVRDHRTGEVHLPHETVAVLQTMQNLGRALFKIKWETGGESMLVADDLEARPQ
jgi:hypothetical protein